MNLAPRILATLVIGIALGGVGPRAWAAEDEGKSASQGLASDATAAAAEHTALAASYDLRIADLDKLIADHQNMKKESRARTYLYRHESPKSREAELATMDKHCDAIIGDATRLRNELAEFAKWHRTQAANMQGK